MAYLHMAYPRGTPADGLTRPRGYRRWPNLYPCGYRGYRGYPRVQVRPSVGFQMA